MADGLNLKIGYTGVYDPNFQRISDPFVRPFYLDKVINPANIDLSQAVGSLATPVTYGLNFNDYLTQGDQFWLKSIFLNIDLGSPASFNGFADQNTELPNGFQFTATIGGNEINLFTIKDVKTNKDFRLYSTEWNVQTRRDVSTQQDKGFIDAENDFTRFGGSFFRFFYRDLTGGGVPDSLEFKIQDDMTQYNIESFNIRAVGVVLDLA